MERACLGLFGFDWSIYGLAGSLGYRRERNRPWSRDYFFFFNHTIEICLQCGVFPPPLLVRLGSCLHLHFLRGLFCCSVGLCLEKMQKVLILSAVEMLDLGWGGLL